MSVAGVEVLKSKRDGGAFMEFWRVLVANFGRFRVVALCHWQTFEGATGMVPLWDPGKKANNHRILCSQQSPLSILLTRLVNK